jgi:hypothetical protein
MNLAPLWAGRPLGYTLSKYGMSLCAIGLAEELAADGIALTVGVVQDRDHQPIVGGDGDADVDVFVTPDPSRVPGGIDLRVVAEGCCARLDEQLVEADPGASFAEVLVDLGAKGQQGVGVDDGGQVIWSMTPVRSIADLRRRAEGVLW